jgi:pyruvate/2-oxoglutarate dehydrogenase complex dihydrolipoamide acyltransferase (E2) component
MDWRLPELGEGLNEADLVAWFVKPGDLVGRYQRLLGVVTDKATFEIPSNFNGEITGLKAEPAQHVQPGQVLLTYLEATTERVWMEIQDPLWMLRELPRGVSSRKLRLFACAGCRQGFHSARSLGFDRKIQWAEQVAEDLVTREARPGEIRWTLGHEITPECAAINAAQAALSLDPKLAAREVTTWTTGGYDEPKEQADLLRHIMGNPFNPAPTPQYLLSSITSLAAALYNGQDVAFALHDALQEAGHPGLAEHFQQVQGHPKGCWVLDLILGKK